jgi:competence protein ComEC
MGDFRIFFYKVGNGHCSYIEFPNGKNALVDLYVSTEENHDNVIDRLRNAGIDSIDYLILTHPHRDHIRGLSAFIDNFKIRTFICSPINFRPDPIYADWEVYEEMRKGKYCQNAHEVTGGWYVSLEDSRIDFIAPLNTLLRAYPDDINNNSLVLRIKSRGHNIIIPGDMETAGWSHINDDEIRDTTLLLASHHGNKSGYNADKTAVKNPAFIVISTGPKTEHDADDRYRKHARKKLYTTRREKILAKIDEKNMLHMIG